MFGCLVEVQYPLRTYGQDSIILEYVNTWAGQCGSTFLGHKVMLLTKQKSPHVSAALPCAVTHQCCLPSIAVVAVVAQGLLCPSKAHQLLLPQGRDSSPLEEPATAFENGKSTAGADNCNEDSIILIRKNQPTNQINKGKTWTQCVCTSSGCEANKLLFQGWEPSCARGKDTADSLLVFKTHTGFFSQ